MKALNHKAKLLGISIAAAGLFAMGTAAQAAPITPITGTINFSGGVFGVDASNNNVSDWNNAVGLKFSPGATQRLNQDVSQTGTYAPLDGLSTTVDFSNFTFKPALSPSPVSPLWTITNAGVTYSFKLSSVAIQSQGSSFLNLAGQGILSATGYTDTTGEWTFAGPGIASGSPAKFNFTSAGSAAVPVPAALFFAAPALLGVFGVSRRKNAAGLAA